MTSERDDIERWKALAAGRSVDVPTPPSRFDMLYGFSQLRPDVAFRMVAEAWWKRWLRIARHPWWWPGMLRDVVLKVLWP